jgi:hypothetical protein
MRKYQVRRKGKNMADSRREDWDRELQGLRQALQGVAEGGAIPQVAVDICAAMKKLPNNEGSHQVFVLGQLEPAQSALLCRADLMPWSTALTGRVFFGDLAGMRAVYGAQQENPGKGAEGPSPTTAYKWIAEPYKLIDDVANKADVGVLAQLLDWGADPNDDGGKWLEKSLRAQNAGFLRLLLDHGADPATVFRTLSELQEAKKSAQVAQIQEALPGRVFSAKVDDESLVESRFVPATGGGGVFRTLFNFRARRVSEVYENNAGTSSSLASIDFGDYDQGVLQAAREDLIRRGGHPREFTQGIDKPRKAGLSPET